MLFNPNCFQYYKNLDKNWIWMFYCFTVLLQGKLIVITEISSLSASSAFNLSHLYRLCVRNVIINRIYNGTKEKLNARSWINITFFHIAISDFVRVFVLMVMHNVRTPQRWSKEIARIWITHFLERMKRIIPQDNCTLKHIFMVGCVFKFLFH